MTTPLHNHPPVDSLTYEQALAELVALVAALEGEQQALSEALSLYERGQALALHCTKLLDQAELKIQQLTPSGLSDFNLPD
jgi:exodeoxyribonuclease VII small subunit